MGQYFFDAENYSIGDTPSKLQIIDLEGTGITMSIQEDVNGNKYLQVMAGGAFMANPVVFSATGGESTDQEIFVEGFLDVGNNIELGGAASASDQEDSYYFSRVSKFGDEILRRELGGWTDLGGSSVSSPNNERRRLRFQKSGNDLKLKSWQYTSTEPSAYQLTVTDSKLDFTFAGAAAYNEETRIYKMGVGTAGDIAPTTSGNLNGSITLQSPSSNATSIPRPTDLTWSYNANDHDSFEIALSFTSNFSEIAYTATEPAGTTTHTVPETKLPNQQVYWRVRAKDLNGNVSSWTSDNFTCADRWGLTASRPLADGTPMLTATEANNLGYPYTESLYWWVGYKSADWPEVTTSQAYFFLASTAHSVSDGGIFMFEADDETGTNMTYRGMIWDASNSRARTGNSSLDQTETPQLIYAPGDPNGRVLHLSLHEAGGSSGQVTRLISRANGDLTDTAGWTDEGELAVSSASFAHSGYMTRIRRATDNWGAWSLYQGSNGSLENDLAHWESTDDLPQYTKIAQYSGEDALPVRYGGFGGAVFANHFRHNPGNGEKRFNIGRSIDRDQLFVAERDGQDATGATGAIDVLLDLTKSQEGGPKSVLTLQDRDGSPLVQNGEIYTYVTYENQGQPSDEPDRVFVYKLSGINEPASTTITGSLAVTDGGEIVSATGQTEVSGTLSVTDGSETLTLSGATKVSGTVSITEAAEQISGTGTVITTGSVSITDGGEIISAVSSLQDITGSAQITDAAENVSATGEVKIAGTATLNDGTEEVIIVGQNDVTGSLSFADLAAEIAATGSVEVQGSLALADAGESITARERVPARLASVDVRLEDIIVVHATLEDTLNVNAKLTD